jgi:gas vesicle protein
MSSKFTNLISKLEQPKEGRETEYQKLDIEPAKAGRSLLHDEFGFLKSGPKKVDKIPPPKEIDNTPVMVKAKTDNDGWIPPKSNFDSVASVGAEDHSWYGSAVTGVVDNNEEVDVDSLQGSNPFRDLSDKSAAMFRNKFGDKLATLLTKITLLIDDSGSNDDLANVVNHSTKIIEKLSKSVSQEYSALANEMIAEFTTELSDRVQDRMRELENEYEDEDGVVHDQMQQEDYSGLEVEEGQYLLSCNGDQKVFETEDSLRRFLSELFMNGFDPENVSVFKRLKIDFGVTIE